MNLPGSAMPDGNRSSRKVEPLTNYIIARIQKGYKEGNTVVGGMMTSTNRYFEDTSLDFLSRNVYTGGLIFYITGKIRSFFLMPV